jgi:hypothetical protein
MAHRRSATRPLHNPAWRLKINPRDQAPLRQGDEPHGEQAALGANATLARPRDRHLAGMLGAALSGRRGSVSKEVGVPYWMESALCRGPAPA